MKNFVDIGKNLNKTLMSTFGIEAMLPEYNKLNNIVQDVFK